MKKYITLVLLVFGIVGWGQTTSTISQTTAGNYTFTVPSGVTSITIECYGGGGGGGGTGANYTTAGGGAGGSYVKYTFNVTSGTTYNYTVGAGGAIGSTSGTDGGQGNSTFFGNTTAGASSGSIVLAIGGAGGKGNLIAGTSSSNFSGGALGGVGSNSGNLPASGATTNAAGSNGTTSIGGLNSIATSGSGGASTGPNAGAAGAGQTNNASNGNPGSASGGGGAGAYRSTGLKSGGLGGDGGVYITYTLPQNITTYITSSSNFNWTCPAGVSKVFVECWGGGGAGGSAYGTTATCAGGGGAGGTYVNGLIDVIATNNYTATVAAAVSSSITNNAAVDGNPSWFSTASTIYAQGGGGGKTVRVTSTTAFGAKGVGSSSSSIGTVKNKGGDGFTPTTSSGSSDKGGGGGSSGGSSAVGNNATSTSGALAVSASDGSGGSGGNQNGGDGGFPGGGGGGARAAASSTQRTGGQGAAGQVIVYSYAVPTIGSLSSTSANLNSTGVTLTITGGSNFYPNNISQITWGGTAITTTYISSTSISAVIDAKLTAAGTFAIGVINTGTYGLSTATSTLNFTVISGSSATDYFRSAVAGSWSTVSNWQSSSDNSTWITATLTPDVNAKGITIRSGFDISTSTTITADDITVDAGATLTIGNSFTVNDGTAAIDLLVKGTLIVGGYTLTNNGAISVIGTFQINQGGYATGGTWSYGASGTLIFNHTSGTYGAINASHSYWPSSNSPFNVSINNASSGGINLGVSRTVAGTFATAAGVALSSSSVLTITGTCQINSGGFFTNTPTYGSASTLIYNTASNSNYNVGNEWTGNSTTAGLGIPQNVTVQNNVTITMPSTNRGLAGNLTVLSGGITLNATSGDMYVGGNWTIGSSASQINNSRAVFFNGGSNQTMTKTGGGTLFFDYLVVDKSAGTLYLDIAPNATDITINTATGNVLQLNNNGSFDLNGREIKLQNAEGNIYTNGTRTLSSSIAGAKLSINGTKYVSGSGTLSIAQNIDTYLAASMDFGSNKTTINGLLQLNSGGAVINNAPIYSNTATLKYFTSGTFGRTLEWSANSASATFPSAGYPNNVQISNNTTLDLGANSGSSIERAINGNLTIDNGSNLDMAGSSAMMKSLTVFGNINVGIAGGTATLTLSVNSGADLKVGGNLTFNGTYNFYPNSRAVFFIKNGTQTISASSTLTIPYVVMAPVSGNNNIQLSGTDLKITAPNGGNAIDLGTQSGNNFDINGRTLTIGTAGVGNIIYGSGNLKGSTTSNLTLLGTGSIDKLNFTTGFRNLGTLTINRQASTTAATLGTDVTINTALVLTNGNLVLNASDLIIASTATSTNNGAASFVITQGNGQFKKYIDANGSFTFPIGETTSGLDYSPATLTYTAASYSNAYLSVNVSDGKHPNNAATSNFITRYWSVTSSGITSPVYSFSGIYTSDDIVGSESNSKPGRYNGTTWTDISSTSISSNTLTLTGLTTFSTTNDFSAGSPLNAGSSVSDYFRSAVAGSWSNASNWQSSSNGSTNWITATIAPDDKSSGITISNNYSITISSGSVTADDITIVSGATLTLSGGTFNLNNGAATVDMQVNGTFTFSGGNFNQGASGIAFGANATYNHAIITSSLTLPTATWDAASNCNITGLNNSTTITAGSTIGQTFGNFTWNTTGGQIDINNSAFNVAGTLTLGTNSTNLLVIANTTGTFTNSIGNIVINGGKLYAVKSLASATLNVVNSITLNGGEFDATKDGTAIVNVSTISVTNANFIVSYASGTGTVNVSNSATVSAGANLWVSFGSGIGTLNVTNLLTVNSSTGFAVIGTATTTATAIGKINTGSVTLVDGNLFANMGPGTGTLTVTNGISISGSAFLLGCSTYTISTSIGNINAGNIDVSGGSFWVTDGPGTCTVTTTNGISVSSGSIYVSYGSGVGNLNVGTDLTLSGTGRFILIRDSTSPSQTVTIARDFNISGTANVDLEYTSSTTGTAVINVGRDFNATASNNVSYYTVNFGTGTVSGNTIAIKGNFTKSGTGAFYTTSTSAATGFSFTGSGTTQTLSYLGTNSNNTSYSIQNNAKVQLNTDLTLGTGSGPNSIFTVIGGGTLNFQTFGIIGNSNAQFITNAGSNLITSNTNGLGGTTATGSLRSFGSIGATTVAGRATFATGANYTFNGATTLPFPIPTSTSGINNFGIPAIINVNVSITSNMITNLSVSSALNVNNGGTFALNSTNNNSVNLNGAALTIFSGGTFDTNGENQVINGSGSPSISITGKFVTRDVQGFVGTNSAIPSITPILNAGSTVEYGLNGDQAVQGLTAPTYQNVSFSGSGTKSLASKNAVVGTITISGSAVFDASNFTFGGSGTNVTMAGTSRFKMAGTSTKPDASGTYSLASGTTIEFANTAATQQDIRLAPTYANVDISGTNVGLSGDSSSLKLQANATFTVKNGGTFNVRNTNGFTGTSNTAIDNTNSPTVTLETGSTINYNCPTANSNQNITPFTNTLTPTPTYTDSNKSYYNMTISGSGTKSISSSNEILIGNNLNVMASNLQININNIVTVNNTITTIDNGIEVQNGGNLVQINDSPTVANSGKIKVNRITRSMKFKDYIYWGSPVKEDVKSQFPAAIDKSYIWKLTGAYDGSWSNFATTTPGVGFITRAATTGNFNFPFVGTPNNGVVSVPAVSYSKGSTFNAIATGNNILLANPYPCAIDASALITGNGGKLGGTLYFWTSLTQNTTGSYTTADYASWNGTGSTATSDTSGGISLKPTGKIAAGQGFFAQILDDFNVTFKNSMRLRTNADNSQFFRNSNTIEKNRIWLNLTSTSAKNIFRQTLVGYVTDATNDIDFLFDGDTYTGNEVDLYSISKNRNLVIQGRALPFDDNDIVPIGYKINTAGAYKISLDEVDGFFLGNQTIYLEDLKLHNTHNLKKNPYIFNSTAGTFDNRFVLHYKNKPLTEQAIDAESGVKVAVNNNQLSILSINYAIEKVVIYDLLGRNIYTNESIQSKEIMIDDLGATQALIVKIILTNGEEVNRKILL